MSDALAASLASDAPAASSPVADTPAVETPSTPATEPSRRDTIRDAVAAQKDKAPPSSEGTNPNAPPKPAAAPAERPRAPDGKFAPAADKPAPDRAAAPASVAPAPAPPADPAAPAPGADAPPHRPPPGWSPASKVAFDALPDSVKADIAKREAEVDRGFAKLAEFKPVEKYAEMAKRGGTTLDRALENYTGIETLLRRDVFAGVEQVLRNVGVNPVSFARAYLQRSSGGAQNVEAPTAPAAHQPAQIDPQTIIRQATDAVRSEYEARQVQSEIQRFASDPKNRFFANVQPKMAQLVQAGIANSIQDAYDQACQLDPEIRRLINAPPVPDPRVAAASQARAAARATVGAPSQGAATPKGALPANATRRQIMLAEIDRQKGARA